MPPPPTPPRTPPTPAGQGSPLPRLRHAGRCGSYVDDIAALLPPDVGAIFRRLRLFRHISFGRADDYAGGAACDAIARGDAFLYRPYAYIASPPARPGLEKYMMMLTLPRVRLLLIYFRPVITPALHIVPREIAAFAMRRDCWGFGQGQYCR